MKHSKRHIEVMVHILVWSLIVFIPFLIFSADTSPKSTKLLYRTLMPIFFSAILFYFNYFLLVRKFIFEKKVWIFIGINLVLIVLCVFGIDSLQPLFVEVKSRGGHDKKQALMYYNMLRYSFTFVLAVGVATAFRMLKQWQRNELVTGLRENENLKSELKNLKYQLQPHFFLNTLNTIYALTDESPEKAKESIHSLGKLMRYLLYHTQGERVKLSNEVEFLKKYIDLMQIRMNENIKINCDFPEHHNDIEIAPLLFIPLVENAFKHGISATQVSFIDVTMNIDPTQLSLIVKNSNYAKDNRDKGGSGIGMENLKKRLSIVYPKKHLFVHEVRDETYYAELIIKL